MKKKDPNELQALLTALIGNSLPSSSIVVKDLNNSFVLTINPDTVYTAASVNKLPILAVLYYLVQNGEMNLDNTIAIQPEEIQDYGTGSIRYDDPGSVYTIHRLAELMIRDSDNTAAYVLARHVIGMEKIQNLIDSWGMAQTDMENNTTSNADMLLLMEKMYRGKIANKPLTEEMFSLLKNGSIEDRIPALLPKNTTMYHKTGNGIGYIHDVGIIEGAHSTYYIGMFTGNVANEKETTTLLSELSKSIYDFMEQ